MIHPSISVIIVSWNHRLLLQRCLDALQAQDYPSFDITLVDNGSSDGSPGFVSSCYPRVQILGFRDNRGFCRAFNYGVSHTRGELLLSVNPDTVVTAGFLREAVRVALQDASIGMIAPKLLREDNTAVLDSTGLFLDRRRRPYDRGQGELDQGQYDLGATGSTADLCYVFGACGAAGLYRRTMLEDLSQNGEYLDESFFAYYEDADLAWRAQLRGWRCAYAPRAVATHARGRGDTLRKPGRAPKTVLGPRLALRNRYLMTIKNDTIPHFLIDLPRILLAETPRVAYAALTRPAIVLGLLDLARALPSAMAQRSQTRMRRRVDDAIVRRWFTHPREMVSSGEE
jgi:GT2 family glycosyltransferase